MAKKNGKGKKSLQTVLSKQAVSSAENGVKKTSNPFEEFKNRGLKHQVLNRKVKGSSRNLSTSKTNALQNRYNRISAQIKSQTKGNTFVDNRFAEYSTDISEEQKALLRFQKTRSKKSRYNIDDDPNSYSDEKDAEIKYALTHMGQSLSTDVIKGSRRGKEDPDEDDEDKDFDPARFVQDLLTAKGYNSHKENGKDDRELSSLVKDVENLKNFDESNVNENKKKTREEVMKEIMLKAKAYKATRQREKEILEAAREKVDDLYEQLFRENNLFNLKPSKGMLKKDMSDVQISFVDFEAMKQQQAQNGEFEKFMKELQYLPKVEATERTLTDHEKAEKEMKKLEMMQKEKIQHEKEMLEKDDFDNRSKRRKLEDDKSNNRSDPYDEEVEDNEDNLQADKFGNKVEAMFSKAEYEESNDSSDDSEDFSMGDDLEDESHEKGTETEKRDANDPVQPSNTLKEMIPFVIKLDDDFTHLDFAKLLSKYSIDFKGDSSLLDTVVDRVLKTNSVHLLAENRKRMVNFYNILVQHLFYIVEVPSISQADSIPLKKIIYKHLFKLSYDLNENLGDIFNPKFSSISKILRDELQLAEENWQRSYGGDLGLDFREASSADDEKIILPHEFLLKLRKGGHKGKKGEKLLEAERELQSVKFQLLYNGETCPKASLVRCWPTNSAIVFYELVFTIFSVNDYRHPMITPTVLLITSALAQAPIRGTGDMLVALKLCEMLTTAFEDKYFPEVICFVSAILKQMCFVQKSTVETRNDIVYLAEILAAETPLKQFRDGMTQNVKDVLWKLIELIALKNYPQKDIFLHPWIGLLKQINQGSLVQLLEDEVNKSKKVSMRLFDDKPKELKRLEPDYSIEYAWKSIDNKDEAESKQVIRKLQKEMKQEKRHVMKEIRRDATMLASEKRRQQELKDSEARKKRLNNMRMIEDMNRTVNNAVRAGEKISGGGSSTVNMRGRRRK